MTINTQAFIQGYLHEKTADEMSDMERRAYDPSRAEPRRLHRLTQKGNRVPAPLPAPPSEQQPLGPIDPPYSFNTPQPAQKYYRAPLDRAIKPTGEHKTRPQRGVPGSDHTPPSALGPGKELRDLLQRDDVGIPRRSRQQWYDNAMSHRYNKGQISEQEYQEYANPKSTGAAKTLRDILGGAKHIAKRYGEDFMKGTSDIAGTAADRTLEGSGN